MKQLIQTFISLLAFTNLGTFAAEAEGTDTIVPTWATHVAGGGSHTVLLDQNGRVYTFGDGYYGRLGHGDTENKIVPTMIEKDATGNPLGFIGPRHDRFVKGASKGEGLGNKFLSNIREVDAIVHAVSYTHLTLPTKA